MHGLQPRAQGMVRMRRYSMGPPVKPEDDRKGGGFAAERTVKPSGFHACHGARSE